MTNSTDNNLNAPIFVIGYLHSGTSLLKNIIGNHPLIYTGQGETRFFSDLPIIKRKHPDLNNESRRVEYIQQIAKMINTNYGKVFFGTAGENGENSDFGITDEQMKQIIANASDVTNYKLLFRNIYDSLTHLFGKKRWLEKTPTHLFHVSEIVDSIPDARFVEIVRDARDVLASKSKRLSSKSFQKADKNRQHIARNSVGFDPLWDTLAWKSAIRSGSSVQSKYPHQIIRMKYEDLVSDPEKETRRICEFLGIQFDIQMLDVPWRNTVDQTKWKEGGISQAAIGRWKSTLSLEAIALSQWIVRKELKQLNYELMSIPLSARLKIPLLFMRSGIEFGQRLYRRYRLGGTTYIRNVLSNYWIRLINIVKS